MTDLVQNGIDCAVPYYMQEVTGNVYQEAEQWIRNGVLPTTMSRDDALDRVQQLIT